MQSACWVLVWLSMELYAEPCEVHMSHVGGVGLIEVVDALIDPHYLLCLALCDVCVCIHYGMSARLCLCVCRIFLTPGGGPSDVVGWCAGGVLRCAAVCCAFD